MPNLKMINAHFNLGRMQMTHHNKFSNESQDARRHDQGKAEHPSEKYGTVKPRQNNHKTDKRKKK